MSQKNGASNGKPDVEALRAEIKQTRAELGETVQALAAKAGVKARAKDQVEQTKQKVRAQAVEATEKVRDAALVATDKVRHAAAQAGAAARGTAEQATDKINDSGAVERAQDVRQVWKLASGDDDAPDATDENRGWGEIIIAAALQGAIFAVVKALVDRGGATGVRKITGTWPD